MVIGYRVKLSAIYNGNLIGWGGIWSVIIVLYKIRRARSASLIWNHNNDFKPKLHYSKFILHFIVYILKLQNSFAQIWIF